MDTSEYYFVIADISGYTRFITSHQESLLHAERIVGNLLEAVMNHSGPGMTIHELLGDAVTMYADPDELSPGEVVARMEQMHVAFEEAESRHISGCSLCSCEACSNVGKLKLKVIAHHGKAVTTVVGGRQKIAGEDVILIHRWLKNEIPSREYFLITRSFVNHWNAEPDQWVEHSEVLEGLGKRTAYYKSLSTDPVAAELGFSQKLRRHIQMNVHAFSRLLGKKPRKFLNLPTG